MNGSFYNLCNFVLEICVCLCIYLPLICILWVNEYSYLYKYYITLFEHSLLNLKRLRKHDFSQNMLKILLYLQSKLNLNSMLWHLGYLFMVSIATRLCICRLLYYLKNKLFCNCIDRNLFSSITVQECYVFDKLITNLT